MESILRTSLCLVFSEFFPSGWGRSASSPPLAGGGSASSPPPAGRVRPPAQTSLARSPGLCCFSAAALAASPHGWDSGLSGRDPWGNLVRDSTALSLPSSLAPSPVLQIPAT